MTTIEYDEDGYAYCIDGCIAHNIGFRKCDDDCSCHCHRGITMSPELIAKQKEFPNGW